MRLRFACLAALVLLVGCGPAEQNPAESYRSGLDQWIVRSGLPSLGIRPCKGSLNAEKCFKMEPARHWRGTWMPGRGEHEQRFCVANAATCRAQPRVNYVLQSEPDDLSIWAVAHDNHATAFIIDFTGRRTTYRIQHSAAGEPVYVIVVDRWRYMEPVEYDPELTRND